jgi:hypothetical protein
MLFPMPQTTAEKATANTHKREGSAAVSVSKDGDDDAHDEPVNMQTQSNKKVCTVSSIFSENPN